MSSLEKCLLKSFTSFQLGYLLSCQIFFIYSGYKSLIRYSQFSVFLVIVYKVATNTDPLIQLEAYNIHARILHDYDLKSFSWLLLSLFYFFKSEVKKC